MNAFVIDATLQECLNTICFVVRSLGLLVQFGELLPFQFGQISTMACKRKADQMISLQEFTFESEGSYKFRKMMSDYKIQMWWAATTSWWSWWSWSSN